MRVRVQVGFAGYRYGEEFAIDELDPAWVLYLEREWVKQVDDTTAGVRVPPGTWRPLIDRGPTTTLTAAPIPGVSIWVPGQPEML